jgi:hypothetical protein
VIAGKCNDPTLASMIKLDAVNEVKFFLYAALISFNRHCMGLPTGRIELGSKRLLLRRAEHFARAFLAEPLGNDDFLATFYRLNAMQRKAIRSAIPVRVIPDCRRTFFGEERVANFGERRAAAIFHVAKRNATRL